MKGNRQTWLGTEDAYHALRSMEEKYFGVKPPEPVAFHGDDDDNHGMDRDFGVPRSRIGLSALERVGNTAVIKVHGTLTNVHRWWHRYFQGELTSYEVIQDALAIAREDDGIDLIVMDYATGGGLVRGLDLTSQHISMTRKVKRVVAHTDSSAFSAGYWLASNSDNLSASRMAEVGSIGTLLVSYVFANTEENQGVTYRVFRAGEFKALGNPYEELTEEAAAYIQQNLEKTNTFFLEHVVAHRNLAMANKAAWGEGKTFFAEEAMAVGLIDKIATLSEVVGSGASQTSTSDPRRFEMNISKEKLAQIEGGADPKDVLTPEELAFYEAQIQANDEGGADDIPGGEPTGEEAEEQEPEAAGAQPEGVVAEVKTLTKEVGRLEAKLEAAEARAEELKEKLEAKEADVLALMDVSKAAVDKLCVAMGKTPESITSPTAMVARYQELTTEMSRRFPTGRQSNTPTGDPVEASAGQRNFRTA